MNILLCNKVVPYICSDMLFILLQSLVLCVNAQLCLLALLVIIRDGGTFFQVGG